jgi:SWI/SNF-related matrix-associated actin-dependent regulator 1 of chromatin subfamily A
MTKNIASIAENNKGEKVVKITFEYEITLLNKVRELPGRLWHPADKCWSAPLHEETVNKLKSWGFLIDSKLQDHLLQNNKVTKEIVINGIPELKGTLRPFQTLGVAFIENKNGRCLIADEMGLGKTIQSIGYISLHRDKTPVIVVCPASLKLNWEREMENWLTNPKTEVLSGTTPYKTKGGILIINYDIVFAWVEELKKLKPQIIILDESHSIKSSATRRTKAVKKLCKDVPHIIALSGTPIVNRPIEIYNTLQILDKNLFPHYLNFTRRYCDAHNNGFGIDVNGASHTDELHNTLTSTVMLRRKKADVLKELPDKIYSFVPLALDNTEEYREAEKDFIAYVRREKGIEAAQRIKSVEALAKIEGLKQLAVKGKLTEAIEWIKNFLESDNKLVVFCTHKFVIDKLMEEFKHIAVKIDGSVTIPDRQRSVDIFQHNPKCKLFVGNIQAAGTGINLQIASNVVFLELPWHSGHVSQAEDRCHRIGQKDSVNVHFLLAKNTIEEKIAKLIDSKRKITDSVLDGKKTEQENLLYEIMKSYL